MLLTDLDPRWITVPGRHGLGMSFECPHCHAFRIPVWFKNPLDGGPPVTREEMKQPPGEELHHWQRTGDTFETMTLSPSIDASKWKHWHGFVRNGQIS